MRIMYIMKCTGYSSATLLRNPVIALLLLTIPLLFFTVTRYTTSTIPLLFKLASVSDQAIVSVPQRYMALVFIALAVAGLLSSLLSFYLIQDQRPEHKRLILCGFRSYEIILSKFILLMIIIFVISVYTSFIIRFFLKPENSLGLLLGLLLIGFVYGSYGMLIGTFSRGDLEGILFIVLLTNLDVGWLQNPVYFIEAQNKDFIKALPSFFPSQVGIVSAFSDFGISRPLTGSIIYGSAFLGIAMFIYYLRMRILKRHKIL